MTPSDIAIVRSFFGPNYAIVEAINDSDGNVAYIGVAPRGSQTSDAVWLIENIVYETISGAKYFKRSRVSPQNSIFDNYASLVYS